MKDGFSNAIYGVIGFNDDQHFKTRQKMGSSDYDTFRSDMLSSEILVNISIRFMQLMPHHSIYMNYSML